MSKNMYRVAKMARDLAPKMLSDLEAFIKESLNNVDSYYIGDEKFLDKRQSMKSVHLIREEMHNKAKSMFFELVNRNPDLTKQEIDFLRNHFDNLITLIDTVLANALVDVNNIKGILNE